MTQPLTILAQPLRRERLHHAITGLALVLIALTLPWQWRFNNLGIGLLILNWLAEGRYTEKWRRWCADRRIGLLLLFFGLHVVALLYTTDQATGWKILEKRAALLVFPLVLPGWVPTHTQYRRVLGAFALSTYAVLLLAFGQAVGGSAEGWFGENLLSGLPISRIYFSLYLLFAWVIVLGGLRPWWRHWAGQAGAVLITLLTAVGLTLLAAKMALLLFGLLLLAGGGYAVWYHRQWYLLACLLGGGLLVGGVVYQASPPLQRYVGHELAHWNETQDANKFNSTNLRWMFWQSALTVIRENPLLGVGPGDSRDALVDVYRKEGVEWGYVFGFNTHNQYLHTAVQLGLVGLLAWVLHLGVGFRAAWQRRNVLLGLLMLIFALACLTEVLVARQKGVVFYAFFQTFLIFNVPLLGSTTTLHETRAPEFV